MIVVNFLKDHIPFQPTSSDYMSLHCFKQVEKGYKSRQTFQSIVNSFKKPPAEGTPRRKRPGRSLFPVPKSKTIDSSGSPNVQVCD